jgi:hypothetical protein
MGKLLGGVTFLLSEDLILIQKVQLHSRKTIRIVIYPFYFYLEFS